MGYIWSDVYLLFIFWNLSKQARVKVCLSYQISGRKQINPENNKNSTEDFAVLFVTNIVFFEAVYNLIRDQNKL